eukprot:gb/GEZJ01006636.1/.p2 GENE.gb/GEZJ01006636.1/~~gb/GEZJ01006636.1/.p2  ORF type:complete len:139 (-),score=11.73 gb/GEZJ01006636.1/:592-1008(-)
MLQLFHATANSAQLPPSATEPETKQATPGGLLATVAVLKREKMIVADVWDYMSPMNNEVFNQRFMEFEKHLMELPREVSSATLGKCNTGNKLFQLAPNGRGASDRDVFNNYFFVDAGPFPRFVSQKLQLINMLVGLGR